VDEADELVRIEEKMLLASTDLSVEEVAGQVAGMGGITIAAHVDRPSFSVLSQLGFIPPDSGLDAVEVSRNMQMDQVRGDFPAIGSMPVISSSDAHMIDDFISGPKTMFFMEAPTLSEIRQALAGKEGRRVHR